MSAPFHFRIYVSGRTAMGERALRNLRAMVQQRAPGAEIEVVDLKDDPARAVEDRILAIPTVVRVRPEPLVRIIGDLSHTDHARDAFGLGEPEVG